MKQWIMILICMVILIGCEEAKVEPSYNLIGLEAKTNEITEIQSDDYFVHDLVMPHYAKLLAYPNEVIIDWNSETSMDVVEGDEFSFAFESFEYLKAFEIETTENIDLKLTFSDNTGEIVSFIKGQDIVKLHENVYTSSLKIEILKGKSQLSEFHIISEMKVDQITYENLLRHDLKINEILMTYDWQSDVKMNAQIAETIIDDYGLTVVDDLAKAADLKRIKLYEESLRGYPILITGQIVEIIEEEEYFKILVDTHIVDEPVVVYTSEVFEKGKNFMMSTLFLGADELLIFYGIK